MIELWLAASPSVEIRLWPLLAGDLVLPSLVLRKPEIVVEKGDKDRLNWELAEAPAAAATKRLLHCDTPLTV